VIVERTENPIWLSNAYLVADDTSGRGVLIDGNDELDPLLERAERRGLELQRQVEPPHPQPFGAHCRHQAGDLLRSGVGPEHVNPLHAIPFRSAGSG